MSMALKKGHDNKSKLRSGRADFGKDKITRMRKGTKTGSVDSAKIPGHVT